MECVWVGKLCNLAMYLVELRARSKICFSETNREAIIRPTNRNCSSLCSLLASKVNLVICWGLLLPCLAQQSRLSANTENYLKSSNTELALFSVPRHWECLWPGADFVGILLQNCLYEADAMETWGGDFVPCVVVWTRTWRLNQHPGDCIFLAVAFYSYKIRSI